MHIEERTIHWEGVYLEVDEHERLVLTFSDHPGEEPHEVVTVVLTDLGDGRTEMRLEQRGTHPPDLYERTLHGWAYFLDRLAERLRAD
jgi:uncharacterized protein YndB with AHSA1/START domain